MPEQDHAKLRRIVELALDAAPADRSAMIDRECGGDADLKKRVEAILSAADDERFLGEPTAERPYSAEGLSTFAAGVRAELTEPGEGPGSLIGPYKLLEKIGEGGFGSVFMAEQASPVRRKVALKIVKLGMDTRQVVARFEQERQALALMDHPNIARVFDAGATHTGRPFFVMELVKGDPIVTFCDKNQLSITERLDLFAQVCAAVQHAHTKGIIHRDIKPSNILVSTLDGRPHPKVIDFGIAKATASKLTEMTFFTEHRQLIGTPQYMSPEQAEGSLDIDTRTDVYSLGVLLYELLTGTTPFARHELHAAAYAEIQRIIREVEPPRPSTRLGQTFGTLVDVAAQRRTDPRRLNAIIRGELDWIVMKALDKDRARRYDTASSLEQDVRRYLAGEVVLASPPSRFYRARAFVRRHRAAVLAVAAVVAVLILGIVGTTLALIDALNQRALADAARLGESSQRELAEARLEETRAIVDFLNDMLAAPDPSALGKDVLVRDVLGRAAGKLQYQFADRPLVASRLHGTLAQTYYGLGDFEQAERHARASAQFCSAQLGDDHVETCDAVNSVAAILVERAKYAEADELLKDAIARQTRLFGRRHATTLRAIDAQVQSFVHQNRRQDALPLATELMENRLATLGSDHQETLSAKNSLAMLQSDLGQDGDAERAYLEVIERLERTSGPDHPNLQEARANLALLDYQQAMQKKRTAPAEYQRRLARARALGEQALEVRRRTLGEEHPDTLISMNNLSSVYHELGLFEESDRLAKANLEASIRTLGEEHPDTIVALANMGGTLRNRKRFDEAIEYLERALRGARKSHPPGTPGTGFILGWYGTSLRELGRYAEAEPMLIEAREIIEQSLGPSHHIAQQMASDLAILYESWHEAEPNRGHDASAEKWRKLCKPK